MKLIRDSQHIKRFPFLKICTFQKKEKRRDSRIGRCPSTNVKIGRGRGEFDERNFPGSSELWSTTTLTLLSIRRTDASSADPSFFFRTRTRQNESLSGKAWLGASSKSEKSNTSWPQLEGYPPRLEFRSCAFKRWIRPKKGFPEAGRRCLYSGSKPSLLIILGRIEWNLRNHGPLPSLLGVFLPSPISSCAYSGTFKAWKRIYDHPCLFGASH